MIIPSFSYSCPSVSVVLNKFVCNYINVDGEYVEKYFFPLVRISYVLRFNPFVTCLLTLPLSKVGSNKPASL
jgi:hypothetical protein